MPRVRSTAAGPHQHTVVSLRGCTTSVVAIRLHRQAQSLDGLPALVTALRPYGRVWSRRFPLKEEVAGSNPARVTLWKIRVRVPTCSSIGESVHESSRSGFESQLVAQSDRAAAKESEPTGVSGPFRKRNVLKGMGFEYSALRGPAHAQACEEKTKPGSWEKW